MHILRHMGGAKIADIDVPTVRRLHRAVEGDERSNRHKRKLGGPGAARRAVRVLSSLLSWAVGEGQLDRNPIIGSLAPRWRRRAHRDPRPAGAICALFETMDAMVAEAKLRPLVRAFVVLVAATGMRRNEARTLRWGDIDLGARRVTLHSPKGARLARQRPEHRDRLAAPQSLRPPLRPYRPEGRLH